MEKTSNIQSLVRVAIILLILLCGFILMKLSPVWRPILDVLVSIAIPFLFAALITYLLHPIIESTHARGVPRPIAVLVIYLLFFGGIAVVIVKGTPFVVGQIRDLIENIPEYVTIVQRWITLFNEHIANLPTGIQDQLNEWLAGLENFLESLFAGFMSFLMGLFNSFIYFIIVPFLVFYLLKDYQLIEKVAWYVTPKKWRKNGIALVRDIDQSLGNFIRGQILVSMSVGILAMTGLWLIGMPYAIVLGLFIGLTDIIPYFGPFIGAIPAVIVAALQSWRMLILATIVIFILQQIEGNILSPVIVGKTLHTHPVIIMLALLTGLEIGGVAGLILAVPTLAVLKVILLHVRTNLHNY